jgi:hypothetical protein
MRSATGEQDEGYQEGDEGKAIISDHKNCPTKKINRRYEKTVIVIRVKAKKAKTVAQHREVTAN